VAPPEPSFGIVRDWALRIGHRATLVPQRGSLVYGLVMSFPLPTLKSYTQTLVSLCTGQLHEKRSFRFPADAVDLIVY
jgi:hypothetical protein